MLNQNKNSTVYETNGKVVSTCGVQKLFIGSACQGKSMKYHDSYAKHR